MRLCACVVCSHGQIALGFAGATTTTDNCRRLNLGVRESSATPTPRPKHLASVHSMMEDSDSDAVVTPRHMSRQAAAVVRAHTPLLDTPPAVVGVLA